MRRRKGVSGIREIEVKKERGREIGRESGRDGQRCRGGMGREEMKGASGRESGREREQGREGVGAFSTAAAAAAVAFAAAAQTAILFTDFGGKELERGKGGRG